MQTKDYFFDNIDYLVAYLYTKVENLSPVKLQKTLYFLYAYYSAMYGKQIENEEREQDYDLPPYLFQAYFEAWRFGPVIRSIHLIQKENETYYHNLAKTMDFNTFFENKGKDGLEVKMFIDDLFKIVNKSSDFSLIDKCLDDKVWQEVIKQGCGTIMPKDEIIEEYRNRFFKRT